MTHWLISANSKYYNHREAFRALKKIDWKNPGVKYEVGDFVYVYATKPISAIEYKCIVEKTDIKYEEKIYDSNFWENKDDDRDHGKNFVRLKLLSFLDSELLNLDFLKRNGLKQAPQSPMRLKDDLLKYILYVDENIRDFDAFIEELSRTGYSEGGKMFVSQNRYERNRHARSACLKYHGYKCKVCDMNFESKYGKIGRNYIHVHHNIPLSEIGENYIVDPIHDLTPVCPNCHAMLHIQKEDGLIHSVEELKAIHSQFIK